jgi:hypothetical protein
LNESKSLYYNEKNYVFAEVLSPQKILGFANHKSTNFKVYDLQIANLQIATFAEGSQI